MLCHSPRTLFAAKHALSLHPGFAEAWCALGVAYAKCGQFDWALEALDEAARQSEHVASQFENERVKIKKLAEKKSKTPRGPRPGDPWVYSEGNTELRKPGDVARAVPVLEMDSLGQMTIRSQFKRILVGHQVGPLHDTVPFNFLSCFR